MQIGETAETLIDYFAGDGELCPCCLRPKHPSASLRETAAVIESRPDLLALEPLPGAGDGRYATAQHHLIPAQQAWARVARLARIGVAVGFDINHAGNGIALPTPAVSYEDDDGQPTAFGALPRERALRIARFWMQELGRQWHDGQNHLDVPGSETSPAGMADEGALDHPGYDQAVIARLVRELAALTIAAPCRDEADRSSEIRQRLTGISDEIRAKLETFATDPRASSPFYVSAAAAALACESQGATR